VSLAKSVAHTDADFARVELMDGAEISRLLKSSGKFSKLHASQVADPIILFLWGWANLSQIFRIFFPPLIFSSLHPIWAWELDT
jgi:hypothetical protein